MRSQVLMTLETHIPLAKISKSLPGVWEDPVVNFHLVLMLLILFFELYCVVHTLYLY